MPTGLELAQAAHRYVGVPYLWNGKTGDGLDCSGLIALALADLGVPFVDGSSAQIAACDPIDVDTAWGIPGALLWREGHDGLVYAHDVSVEAVTPAVTLLGRSDTYDGGKVRFTHAGLIPGIDYQEADVALPLITSKYGPRRIVVDGQLRTWPHRGLDLRSPKGAEVVSLFSGNVRRVASRVPGAPIGRVDREGNLPLASTVSGGGTIVERDGGGFYVEVHMDPSVKVGQRVTALKTVLGRTDLSGQITGAHRHVELWTRLDPDTHYDPTAALKAAAAGNKGTTPAPTPTPQEDDDMTPEQAALLQDTATKVNHLYQALFNGSKANGQTYPAVVESLRTNPADSAGATLGAWLGRGNNRRTVAAAIAGTESDVEVILGRTKEN